MSVARITMCASAVLLAAAASFGAAGRPGDPRAGPLWEANGTVYRLLVSSASIHDDAAFAANDAAIQRHLSLLETNTLSASTAQTYRSARVKISQGVEDYRQAKRATGRERSRLVALGNALMEAAKALLKQAFDLFVAVYPRLNAGEGWRQQERPPNPSPIPTPAPQPQPQPPQATPPLKLQTAALDLAKALRMKLRFESTTPALESRIRQDLGVIGSDPRAGTCYRSFANANEYTSLAIAYYGKAESDPQAAQRWRSLSTDNEISANAAILRGEKCLGLRCVPPPLPPPSWWTFDDCYRWCVTHNDNDHDQEDCLAICEEWFLRR